MTTATAIAASNIALVKYWGKRDSNLNLPATGSVSMTLSSFRTRTCVTCLPSADHDDISLDHRPATAKEFSRLSSFLDLVRQKAQQNTRFKVETENNFPTASGLASSASGFAALAGAASRAAGLSLSSEELAALARQGSGSAARSVLGGWVELIAGNDAQGQDFAVRQILEPDAWDLRLVVACTDRSPKKLGSTEAMERTRRSSAYYGAWIETHDADRKEAVEAIEARNFQRLGEITERSCFKMHAVALAAEPAILYWKPATLSVLETVWQYRADGMAGYVTMDAGPHVKVLCEAEKAERFRKNLETVEGVSAVFVERPGRGLTYEIDDRQENKSS